MNPPATTWLARTHRHLRAPMLLLCLVVGCHSIRFGPTLSHNPTRPMVRVAATFGTPTIADDEPPLLQQVAVKEKDKPVPPLAPRPSPLTPDDSPLTTHSPPFLEIIDLPTALARAGADN